jgi:hypothetical protein
LSRSLLLVLLALPFIPTTASGAAARDRDGDRLPDRWERRYHLSTSWKSARGDADRDGLSNLREYRLRTNPRRRDSDRDGVRDGAEVRRYHTSPRKQDTDGDGYGDGVEIRAGTSPRKRASHPSGTPAPAAAGAPAPAAAGAPAPPAAGAPAPPPTAGAPSPAPSGFPDAASTGVPAGTALTAYSGPSTISTPGTVIDGKSMGCIRVVAAGVVIRRSKISCAGGAYAVLSGDGDYSGAPLVVEDSEIDCRNGPGTALGEANITVRRVDIFGCENGGDMNQNFIVEDSYIHDLYNGESAHTDGLQFASGHREDGQVVPGSLNVTIRHNTIFGMGADGSFGTSAIISNRGGDRNVLIENNLLGGGAVAIYCEQDAKGINYRVINNAFTRRFGPKVGFYGVSTDCSDEEQSGNYYYETGQPLTLP